MPLFIYPRILSPSPVDCTLRIFLLWLVSFHSHCPSLLSHAWTKATACVWSSAADIILQMVTVFTHPLFHPLFHWSNVQTPLHDFPDKLKFVPTCCWAPGVALPDSTVPGCIQFYGTRLSLPAFKA